MIDKYVNNYSSVCGGWEGWMKGMEGGFWEGEKKRRDTLSDYCPSKLYEM